VILVLVIGTPRLRLHQRLPQNTAKRRRDLDLDGRRGHRWRSRSPRCSTRGRVHSISVARRRANDVVDSAVITPTIVFAGLIGRSLNLVTW